MELELKYHRPVPASLLTAILKALLLDGEDVLYSGLETLRDVVEKLPWEERKAIPTAEQFYSFRLYLKDSAEWAEYLEAKGL